MHRSTPSFGGCTKRRSATTIPKPKRPNNRCMLRFNQFVNIYLQTENIAQDAVKPYQEFIVRLEKEFQAIYAKGEQDHTIRTDVPEVEMFSTTLHLMLAVVTRYAVGLAYQPGDGFDAEKELETQKRMLLREYLPQDVTD